MRRSNHREFGQPAFRFRLQRPCLVASQTADAVGREALQGGVRVDDPVVAHPHSPRSVPTHRSPSSPASARMRIAGQALLFGQRRKIAGHRSGPRALRRACRPKMVPAGGALHHRAPYRWWGDLRVTVKEPSAGPGTGSDRAWCRPTGVPSRTFGQSVDGRSATSRRGCENCSISPFCKTAETARARADPEVAVTAFGKAHRSISSARPSAVL